MILFWIAFTLDVTSEEASFPDNIRSCFSSSPTLEVQRTHVARSGKKKKGGKITHSSSLSLPLSRPFSSSYSSFTLEGRSDYQRRKWKREGGEVNS